MQIAKTYDWRDSNVELFGSNEDRAVKKSSAENERAWDQAKACVCAELFVWKIEKFKVVEWPKEKYGEFNGRNSYIVLNVYLKENELLYDVHFWIGKFSTQDEYGTGAYKTLELKNLLNGKPVQHREVQHEESGLFKSYFHNLIMDTFDPNETFEETEFNCSFLESLPRSIKNIISWHCPVVTGSLLVSWLMFAIMVKTMSFISVIAYLGLLFIISSMVLRFYSNFINNEVANPFQEYLEKDVNAYLTKISDYVHYETTDNDSHFRKLIAYLNSIFLLESYADGFKFFLFNVAMIYVGMYFNLIDLVTLVVLFLLTGPKIYSIYRIQIDEAAIKAREHVVRCVAMMKEKLATLPVIGGKMKQI